MWRQLSERSLIEGAPQTGCPFGVPAALCGPAYSAPGSRGVSGSLVYAPGASGRRCPDKAPGGPSPAYAAAMTISPVALALIGIGATVLGAVLAMISTLISTRMTQRATRDRESDFKVWERRADAIEEAHRKMLALGNARDLAWQRREVPTNLSPQGFDSGHQDEQFRLVVTKLMLYTTDELVEAYQASNTAFLKSILAIQMLELALAETGGPQATRRRDINLKGPCRGSGRRRFAGC
ncbi:hypothetical protein SCALM49S_09437 [Streptomyces californicus]